MTNPQKVYDLAIVGGGPVGLFGLFYASLRDMEAVLLDSLPELGGQLAALYPEKDIYDMPGFPKVKAKDLADAMVEQATMHKKQDFVLGERVELLERVDDAASDGNGDGPGHDGARHIYRIRTSKGSEVLARTVLLTTGAGAFRPNRLPVEGAEALEDRSIHYFVKNKAQFDQKRVLVLGGGDSAMDWVLALHESAASVDLIHRRDAFRAHEDSVTKVMALSHVPKHLFCEVKALVVHPTNGALEAAMVLDTKSGETRSIACDHIIATLGFAADIGPLASWGLELEGKYILVNTRKETNLPGVYAAGDIATFPGKLKLIATGVGEAAIAVNAAKHHIDPSQREQPPHSTTLFEKKKPKAGAPE